MSKLLTILRHSWLEQWRSPVFAKNILINIFLGLTVVYLAANLVFLGFVLDDVLLKIFPKESPLDKLNAYLLYYFFFDLLLRYFMQKLPVTAMQPYLHLPVSESKLVHFTLIKSIWSPFNWLHLLIFLPFAFEIPFKYYGFGEALGWTMAIVMMVFANNFLLLYLKRKSEVNTTLYLAMLGSLAVVIGLEYFDIFDFTRLSSVFFGSFYKMPFMVVVPLLATTAFYAINHKFLARNAYLEELSPRSSKSVSFAGRGWLSRFGRIGHLIELDFKLIWRNKRPKSVLLLTLLFLGYGLLLFPNEDFEGNHMIYILFSIIITGMFTLNYGQYLLGWEGDHFDEILVRNISPEAYYRSKFYLFSMVSVACMILSVPYVYFGWDILLNLFCVFLFNVGVNSFVVMFFGSLNPKKIDLKQSTVFNWQGVGAAQFILAIPVLFLPFAIFSLGAWIWDSTGGLLLVGAIGVLGLLTSKYSIQALGWWLRSRKYEIAESFRNS